MKLKSFRIPFSIQKTYALINYIDITKIIENVSSYNSNCIFNDVNNSKSMIAFNQHVLLQNNTIRDISR